jgi:hypothetical protein
MAAAGCAQGWADAVGSYAAGLLPVSTTVPAATTALAAALQSAFESLSAGSAVDDAFAAFAVAVAAGQLPLFTGVPPGSPLGVVAQLSDPQETHALAAALFTALIDGWLKTGTATLVAPPNTLVQWT